MMAIILGRESTGGAVARVGFAYQDAFVLQHIPLWLSQSGFSHVVSEAIGDVEVCYHRPAGGVLRVLHEAKDYALTATEFWGEIVHFKEAFDAAPSEFRRFKLVCRGYKPVTSPLVSMLDRLRGVGSSFDEDSTVISSGRQHVVDWVVAKGQSIEIAEFVLDHVDFVTYASENVEATFIGKVEHHLPVLNLRAKEAGVLCAKYKALVEQTASGPVYRRELESAIVETLGQDAGTWLSTPTSISLVQAETSVEELGLAVGEFNGPERAHKAPSDWGAVAAAAAGVAQFIKSSRQRRGIALNGKQRMSLACLMGFNFSATRGFFLQVEHNGALYRTDDHDKADGVFFTETMELGEAGPTEGVVTIGFPSAVGTDIDFPATVSLSGLPRLSLGSRMAIDG